MPVSSPRTDGPQYVLFSECSNWEGGEWTGDGESSIAVYWTLPEAEQAFRLKGAALQKSAEANLAQWREGVSAGWLVKEGGFSEITILLHFGLELLEKCIRGDDEYGQVLDLIEANFTNYVVRENCFDYYFEKGRTKANIVDVLKSFDAEMFLDALLDASGS